MSNPFSGEESLTLIFFFLIFLSMVESDLLILRILIFDKEKEKGVKLCLL